MFFLIGKSGSSRFSLSGGTIYRGNVWHLFKFLYYKEISFWILEYIDFLVS